jgi:hypothetical protein
MVFIACTINFCTINGLYIDLICEILRSHGGEYEAQNLLGCTAVFLIECLPTFQRCMLPWLWRQYIPEDSELDLIWCSYCNNIITLLKNINFYNFNMKTGGHCHLSLLTRSEYRHTIFFQILLHITMTLQLHKLCSHGLPVSRVTTVLMNYEGCGRRRPTYVRRWG